MSGIIPKIHPWVAKWGEGERFDGGGQGDTFLVPDRTTPRGVMKLLKDHRAGDPKSRRRMFQEVSNLKILHSAGARVPQILDDNTSEFENLGVPLAVAAQAAAADLQRAQAFLQAFLERAANGHRFAHAFHLRGERGVGLWKFLEGKARIWRT